MRNKIINEILQGNHETNDLIKYLGCSERYAQSVKKELKEISAKGGSLEFIPVCSACNLQYNVIISVVLDKKWKDNIRDKIKSNGWFFDINLGFFFCPKCENKDDGFNKDDVFIGIEGLKNVDLVAVPEAIIPEAVIDSEVASTESIVSVASEIDSEIDEAFQANMAFNSMEGLIPHDYVKNVASSDTWEVKLDCVSECSKAPKEVDVYLSAIAISKMRLFMSWAGAQEWLAYLLGEDKDDKMFVNDLILPKQNASSALVDEVLCDNYNGVIGVIHSHHEMGGAADPNKPHFSGHDDNFINGNHNLSLLIAKDGISGHVRLKVSCGAYIKVKANIHKQVDDRIDKEVLKKEFEEKIKFRGGNGGGNGGNGGKGKKNREWRKIKGQNSYVYIQRSYE